MINLRKYGNAPFNVAVIHGGPGAPGEMLPVARELSRTHGVLEPLQTASTLEGQVEELRVVLQEAAGLSVILIGYSYGAMLSFMFSAKNSRLVKKLIMVSSGVFEDRYAVGIMKTRMSRLTEEERAAVDSLLKTLDDPHGKEDKNKIFARIGEYLAKADAYAPLPYENEVIECQHNIHDSVWQDVAELRSGGKLLALGKRIQCPVIAIHGDYDPHPAEGVKVPLSRVLKDFRFILLEKCGHKPWAEREARDRFYEILKKEMG